MKNTVLLYPILFEAEDTISLDLGKDVADAIKTAIEPIDKRLGQIEKDVNVIQKGSGEKKQEPTKARSTTGPEQTSSATTVPKGPGTVSPSATTGTSAENQPNAPQKIASDIADKVADRVSKELNKKD